MEHGAIDRLDQKQIGIDDPQPNARDLTEQRRPGPSILRDFNRDFTYARSLDFSDRTVRPVRVRWRKLMAEEANRLVEIGVGKREASSGFDDAEQSIDRAQRGAVRGEILNDQLPKGGSLFEQRKCRRTGAASIEQDRSPNRAGLAVLGQLRCVQIEVHEFIIMRTLMSRDKGSQRTSARSRDGQT